MGSNPTLPEFKFLTYMGLRSSSFNNFVLKFFTKVYNYQPGGLAAEPAAYTIARRKDILITSPGKVLPILRKALSFAYSSGSYLGSITFVADTGVKSSLFSTVMSDFLSFCRRVFPRLLAKSVPWTQLVRLWQTPFRPGFIRLWIPGTLTNYYGVQRAYTNRSRPKVLDKGPHRLSSDLQSWFLPRWFPSYLVVFGLEKGAVAIREASKFGIPSTSVGFSHSQGVRISEITYPVVGDSNASAGCFMYAASVQNYYSGVAERLKGISKVRGYYVKQMLRVSAGPKVIPKPVSRSRYNKRPYDPEANKLVSVTYKGSQVQSTMTKREFDRLKAVEESKPQKDYSRFPEVKRYFPTLEEKVLFFQPFMDAKGKTREERQAELERRHTRYALINKLAKPRKSDFPTFLGYGLFLDKASNYKVPERRKR